MIAAFQEKDEEDHGEESASITLARCHKNSEKTKKKSSHEGSKKGTRWLHVLEVENFRLASSRMPGIWYLLFCMSHREPGVWRGPTLGRLVFGEGSGARLPPWTPFTLHANETRWINYSFMKSHGKRIVSIVLPVLPIRAGEDMESK